MAPEQLLGQRVDRRTDVFAAGVMLWETLSGKRLFRSSNPGETVQRVLNAEVPLLSDFVPGVSTALAQVVATAIERPIDRRYATAHDFACALEAVTELVSARAVGEWVEHVAGDQLERRSARLRQIESASVVATGVLSVSDAEENEITGLRASSPEFRAADRADGDATRTRTATWIAGADLPSRPLHSVERSPSTDSAPELTPAVAPTALDSRAFSHGERTPERSRRPLLWWGAAALFLGAGLLVWRPWQAELGRDGSPALAAAPSPAVAVRAEAPPAASPSAAPSPIPTSPAAASETPANAADAGAATAPGVDTTTKKRVTTTSAVKRPKAKPTTTTTTAPATVAPKRAEDLFSRN
jgi:serine/threonine-protein kinase